MPKKKTTKKKLLKPYDYFKAGFISGFRACEKHISERMAEEQKKFLQGFAYRAPKKKKR